PISRGKGLIHIITKSVWKKIVKIALVMTEKRLPIVSISWLLADQYLPGRSLSQKICGACCGTISTGAEYCDNITDLGLRHFGMVAQKIQRCAQTSHNCHDLFRGFVILGSNGSGIVTATDRSEIATGRQLVMKTTIGNQKRLSLTGFAVNDPGQINTGLANKITSQLNSKLRVRQYFRQSGSLLF